MRTRVERKLPISGSSHTAVERLDRSPGAAALGIRAMARFHALGD